MVTYDAERRAAVIIITMSENRSQNLPVCRMWRECVEKARCTMLPPTSCLKTWIGQTGSHRWMIYTCINWFYLILHESSNFFKIICHPSQISNVPFYSGIELFPPPFELKDALPYWFCIRRTTSDWDSANQSKPTLISKCGANKMLN